MFIKKREKYKSTALFRCDNCLNEWMGNYYVLIKKNNHFCPSCCCKKGKVKNRKKTSIPVKIRKYIIKRVDGEGFSYLPKNKKIKIIVECPICNTQRQTNSFDVLSKETTVCIKCCNNKPKKGYDYRKNKKYRQDMSKSVKTSDAYKKSIYNRIESNKKYWKNLRNGKDLDEIYSKWELYKKKAYRIVEKNYKNYKNIINPDNLPRGRDKYHIDHKFSILEGFKQNIPEEIISNTFNLTMMYYIDNLNKKDKCSITKKQLYREWRKYTST